MAKAKKESKSTKARKEAQVEEIKEVKTVVNEDGSIEFAPGEHPRDVRKTREAKEVEEAE